MSIPDIWHKIKGSTTIDKTTIVYLFTVVGVGIASFGLGRISVISKTEDVKGIAITQNDDVSTNRSFSQQTKKTTTNIQSGIEKNYVASKNGKLYYPASCKSSNRIKEENRVWFAQAADAEKSGYSRSSSCK